MKKTNMKLQKNKKAFHKLQMSFYWANTFGHCLTEFLLEFYLSGDDQP